VKRTSEGADTAIINAFRTKTACPITRPDGEQVDNHDMLTGTGETGQLFSTEWKYTCHDWTSPVGRRDSARRTFVATLGRRPRWRHEQRKRTGCLRSTKPAALLRESRRNGGT
jgi:hypothetical protein